MESVRDYPITIAKSANAIGKSHCAARIAIWAYKCFPDCQVYTAAAPPENNLKRILWGEIGDVFTSHPDLFQSDSITNLNIQKSTRSFIAGVTIPSSGTPQQREAKFSGKHAPYLFFIIDEGDAVPEEVYSGIESCMSGGHARLLVMFNPRSETGILSRMERDGKANIVKLSAFNHPNIKEGKEIIPGAVNIQKTVTRINEWTRKLTPDETPDSNCFELPAFLNGKIALKNDGSEFPPLIPSWYTIEESAFSYMVLGEYPAQGSNQLISRDWINKARSNFDLYTSTFGAKTPEGVRPIMGQDVAEFGNDLNMSCFRYGNYVAPFVRWSGMTILRTGRKAIEEYAEKKAVVCYVDATGVGAGVAPIMNDRGCNAKRVMVASRPTIKTDLGEFGILRDQLWWSCREWLKTGEAMLPPDEQLIEELLAPTYEVKDGKIRIMKKDVMKDLLKRSPDKADSLCLTFGGEGAREPRIRII